MHRFALSLALGIQVASCGQPAESDTSSSHYGPEPPKGGTPNRASRSPAAFGVPALAGSDVGNSHNENCWSDTAKGQEASASPGLGVGADQIPIVLEQAKETRAPLLDIGPAQAARDLWRHANDRLEDRIGLRLGVAYNSLVQGAAEARGEDLASSGEFQFQGRWRLWGKTSGNLGFIDFQARHRHRYGRIAPAELGTSVGSLWPTVRGFTDAGWQLPAFYWEQYLFDSRLAFRTGQTTIDNLFDVHALRSSRLFFLNSAFSDNPAIAFPRFGPAAAVMVRPVDELEVLAGIADVDGRELESLVDGLYRRDDFFTAIQAAWRPSWRGERNTQLQAMYWYADASSESRTPSGGGFATLAQQRFGDRTLAFIRYAYGDGTVALARHMVSVGGAVVPCSSRKDDLAGLAFARGRPSLEVLREQSVVEAFYRLQLMPGLRITPDLQLLIDPSLNPKHDFIVVFGMRVRWEF